MNSATITKGRVIPKASKARSVAEFVTQAIAATGKTQLEVAREAGFDKPNVITMIKQGSTKLPIPRVKAMARALEVEPLVLLKLCLKEYHPEMYDVLHEFIFMHEPK